MVGQPSHTRGHVITDLATHRNASSRLRFPSPECPLVVCQRTQSTPDVGILQARCLYARLRRRTAASGPGQGCLVSDIDCISARSVRTA